MDNNCPCDLIIVIAQESIIGNCLLESLKGHGDCEGDIDILGM